MKLSSAAIALLTLGLGLPLAACGTDDMPEPPGVLVRSAVQRELAPQVPAADATSLSEGNLAFAMNLYQELRSEPGNLFYSPHSISSALAMTYAGARSDTETQMAQALQYRLPQDRLHAAFNALDQALVSRGQGAEGKDNKPFRLRVANALFAQEGYTLQDSFLDTLARNYGAGVSLFDFTNRSEEARQAINAWVEDATEGRIDELLAQGVLTPATRLVLTNAVYFNASWQSPFESSATKDEPFNAPSGQVTARMMHANQELLYASGEGYQAVALPYDGGELDMVVVMPGAERFDSFESALDGPTLSTILSDLSSAQVQLSLPKFETRFETSLVKPLKALGMSDAFSGAADLSGIDGSQDLYVQDVVHEAFVKVDEAGTEAAAATAVIVGRTSLPPEQVTLTVDRPFIFLIRDRATDAIVFAGRIVDPT